MPPIVCQLRSSCVQLTRRSWPEAIAANPARSLATPDLAMDYFAHSPFFDTQSNNSVLRTQRRVENPTYGHAEEKV